MKPSPPPHGSPEPPLPHGSDAVTARVLQEHFHLPEKTVARMFDVCLTSFKKICRTHQIKRWPYRKYKSLSSKLAKVEAATAIGSASGKELHRAEKKRKTILLGLQSLGYQQHSPRDTKAGDHDSQNCAPREGEYADYCQPTDGEFAGLPPHCAPGSQWQIIVPNTPSTGSGGSVHSYSSVAFDSETEKLEQDAGSGDGGRGSSDDQDYDEISPHAQYFNMPSQDELHAMQSGAMWGDVHRSSMPVMSGRYNDLGDGANPVNIGNFDALSWSDMPTRPRPESHSAQPDMDLSLLTAASHQHPNHRSYAPEMPSHFVARAKSEPQDQDAQRSTALKWYMGAPSGLSLYTSQSEEFTGQQSEVFDGFPFGNFPTSSSAQACMPQHQQQEANTWDDVCSDVAGGYKHVLYTGGAPPPNVYHNMDSGGPSTLMHHTSRPFL